MIWPGLPIKRIGDVFLGKMIQPEQKSASDVAAPYLRAAHVQPNGQIIDVDDKTMWFRDGELALHDLRRDDVVIVEGGAGYGRSAVIRDDRDGWGFQNSIVRIRPQPALASGRFLDYALQSALAAGEVEVACFTATIPHFTADKVGAFQVPAPPVGAQRAIADYLDRETPRIDTLIEEQQRLIETLRERRRSAISSTVARGLDESVALKDSGLPGAGPVPAHWVVRPLRYTISFQEGPGIMAADFRDEGVPLLRVSSVRSARSTLEGCNYLDPADVERRWSHFRVDLGDLLISASASMGTVSEVTEETAGSVPYTGIIRIKPGRMHKDFIRWFVVSGEFIDQVDSLKTGSTIQHFGPTHLAQMRVALPPADEQRQIAAYLDEETAKIDTLIAETERFIDLARERRAALITAAVTGQIDVREMA
ncbi:MAG TPA: restriction endonuclease subunit S [Amycolatopsis sp.]|nr:restriction endonuclease subunit S [Amycolatopsis sp.]